MSLQRVRVLHILPSGNGYGVERQVTELVAGLRASDVAAQRSSAFRSNTLCLPRLVGELRAFRPHVVHTHSYGRYWGGAAALLAGVPHIVHTEHNPCDPARTRFARVADPLLNSKTERVVTFFGEQLPFLRWVSGWPREKFALIPHGITPCAAPDCTRESARNLMQVGNGQFTVLLVGCRKNQKLAQQAFAKMRPEIRARTVFYVPPPHHVDLRALLPGADLVMMASRFEGMPHALLEAMSSSVPVLTTPWTGSRTMLGDGRYGFITRSFDPKDIALTLERAIEHPLARETFARRAYRFVQESYTIARTISAHAELYNDVCGIAQ